MTFFEMLTGTKPRPSLADLKQDLPALFFPIVERLLTSDADRGYRSCGEIADDLRKAEAHIQGTH